MAKIRSEGWAKLDARGAERARVPGPRSGASGAPAVTPSRSGGDDGASRGASERDDVRGEVVDHRAERDDVEDALAALQQVDDLAVERASTEPLGVSTRLVAARSWPRPSRRQSTARRARWSETPASRSDLITFSSSTSV